MSEDDTDRARQSCERLAIAVYSLMDQGRYAETAALFADDAVWVRGGTPVHGRDAILAALERRPATEVTRHLVTNVMVSVNGADSAEGTACFVPFRGERAVDGPGRLPPITMIGDLRFAFSRTEAGWRITQLRPTPVLKA